MSQRFQKEHDVSQALRTLGHDVQFLGVSDDLTPIRQHVEGWDPDVVFNLLMEFQDVAVYQSHIASYLELLRVAQAGCNPRGLVLARDKALAKKILRYHRIPTPAFRVFRRGQKVGNAKLRFPQIVKSLDEEASLGISQSSTKRVYRALDLSAYARIDFRLSDDGAPFVLEANPNPDLRNDEDLAASAAAGGVSYPQLIQRIVNLGLQYRSAWKELE
jgi:D-alanine-D-alanine ligase-like ATP-grasp enzyme